MTLSSEFQQRLRDINPPIFRMVEGAAAFAALNGEPKATPAAFVLVEEEQSSPNERMTGRLAQRCEADVAIIIVTRNVSDGTGGAAAEDNEAVKAKVREALIGFEPATVNNADVVEHISSNLLKAKNGYVWQRELFGAGYYLVEKT
ncbi:phage tail terminator protein [Mesorhizobium qingshengii]|uniref:Uncharacterized protein n=1 Tax=Mesorhizobium qingshengii TaxID=1165689 RepID=A0A1G5V189_9HYPH|nr:hypothetical protein [Mesorhizobium qingshengii]SDA39146.1 hypothetical protein SAMN02927914_00116 [Mesorhizobium qingshengii]